MRAGGGKAKGSQFERDVCKKLSLWLSNGTHEDLLWRSAMSGGRSTVAHKKGKRLAAQAGDISSIHELSAPFMNKFMVECKTYQDLNIFGLITGKGKLIEFWNEASDQALRYDKEPILIAHQVRYPTFICLNDYGVAQVTAARHPLDIPLAPRVRIPYLNMNIFLLEEFLAECRFVA